MKPMKKNNIIKWIILVILVLAFCGNIRYSYYWNYQVTSGTGIVSGISDYEFTPFMASEDDVIEQTFSPSHSGLESIEIRLANEHTGEDDCVLSFWIKDKDDNIIFQQDVDSVNIENWRYYTLTFPETLKKGMRYTLSVQCTEDKAGVPYKIFLCKDNLKENRQLYFDGSELEGNLDIMYHYTVFPWGRFLMLNVLMIFSAFLLLHRTHLGNTVIYSVVSIFVFPAYYVWIVEILSDNSLSNMSFPALLLNWCIIFAFSGVICGISGSVFVGELLTGFISIGLAIVNHYVLIFRGSVILPSDIFSITTATNVAMNYSISMDREVLILCVSFPIALVLLYQVQTRLKRKGRWMCAMGSIPVIAAVVILCNSDDLAKKFDVQVKQDSQTYRSHQVGFLLNTIENIKYFVVDKPKNYDEEVVKDILQSDDENSDGTDSPNIIVIMNESLSDLRYLGDFETSEEYLSNFYEAAQSKNSKIGKSVVSVFGGGTSCSEFEFLTGSSMLFLGSGNAPYQQYIHDETEALPSFLNEVYESYAIHPANPSSWSRNVAYPLIGFKEFISIDNTVFDNASYCRWWIDDQSLYDVVENMYEEIEQPVFIFGLTIQCHGGYTYENFENTVEVLNMSKSYDDVNQYLSLVKSTDDGFGNLLENISESDEPTIVLMFGDHLPSLDTDFYAELSDNQEYDERDEKLLKYETPYIIWANYDVDLSDIPDVISVNFLAPYLLNAAGIKLDGFYQYLYDLSQMYPVISRSGIMDAEGNLYDYSEDSACYDAVHMYEMVQYYRLFGK